MCIFDTTNFKYPVQKKELAVQKKELAVQKKELAVQKKEHEQVVFKIGLNKLFL